MPKMLKGLTFAGLIALSLLASGSNASAHDAKSCRETAWTIDPLPEVWDLLEPIGVTWEE